MYLSHFQLNLKPFQVNSDNRFLYLSEKHEEALAILRYGILDNRGILVLTGDVGTGKTILIHALVETLGPDVQTAMITDPSLTGIDFFNYLAHAFGIGAESKTKGEFLIRFGNFLDGLFEANQQALLIIDEAQCIDPVQLEEVRMLSDFERENYKGLNVFFVGQDEFDVLLAKNRLRALKQRITTHYHIAPLTHKETGLYIQYRLKVAGCDRPLFTPSALDKIFGLTNGYPRLINIICDHCLLSAFVKRVHQIDPAIVEESVKDLMHPSQLNEEPHGSLGNMPGLPITPPVAIQPAAAPTMPPEVTTPAPTPIDPPARAKPFASLLPPFLRKPAYLLAVALLVPALVWFNFRADPDPKTQASWPSPKLHQEDQSKAHITPLQSPTLDKHLSAPSMKPGPVLSPDDVVTQTPSEQPLVNTATVSADQLASPTAAPTTIRSEDIAAPPMELSPAAPTVIQPLVVDQPSNTDPARLEKETPENLEPHSAALKPEEIGAYDEMAEAAETVSNASSLSTIPVATETDAPPLPSETQDGTEWVAAPPATMPPSTASAPVEAPDKIKPDQATPSENLEPHSAALKPEEIGAYDEKAEAAETVSNASSLSTIPVATETDAPPLPSPIDAANAAVDAPPQEPATTPLPAPALDEPAAGELEFQNTESDPRAIIDYVLRKRSQQSGDQ